MRLPTEIPLATHPYTVESHAISNLHRHDVMEIGVCHSGRGLFVIEGKTYTFSAGDVLLVAPHEYHRAQSFADSPGQWTFCFCDPIRVLGTAMPSDGDVDALWGPQFPNVLSPADHPVLCALAQALIQEAQGRRDPAVLRASLGALLSAARLLPGRQVGGTRRHRLLERLAPALARLDVSRDQRVPIPRLAARCGLSAAQLRRDFHDAFGCSPQDYQVRLRIQQAAILLRAGGDVLSTALACGFDSANGFTRRFRAVMGCAPAAWRDQA